MSSQQRNIDTEFVKKYGRFRITWSNLNIFFILFFGLSVLFMMAFIGNNNLGTFRFSYFPLLVLFQVPLVLLFGKIILREVAFKAFETGFTKDQNLKLIGEVLGNFSLPEYHTKDSDLIYSTYKFGLLNLYSKDVYFIVISNTVMLNIRNSIGYNFYYFNGKLKKRIENELSDRIRNWESLHQEDVMSFKLRRHMNCYNATLLNCFFTLITHHPIAIGFKPSLKPKTLHLTPKTLHLIPYT